MTAWTELTLEYTSALCRIPLATLQATSARCLKHTRDTNPYDGPWGIIRFTREPSTPELLMFAIMTLDGELLDLPDYEPFSTIGGTLVL